MVLLPKGKEQTLLKTTAVEGQACSEDWVVLNE